MRLWIAGAVHESEVRSAARAGTDRAIHPGEDGGTYSNGMQWQLTVAPYGNGDDTKAWNMTAYSVRATVSPI